MTQRRPAGKSWESWEEGAFDNLAGTGKPLADLGEHYDPDWWVKKLIQREKVSMLPPSLELLSPGSMRRRWSLNGAVSGRRDYSTRRSLNARARSRAT